MINISQRLRKGREMEQAARGTEEVLKLGNLRAGMTGIMSSQTGDIAGQCHRMTHLRQLGVNLEVPDENKLIMFELGFASEDITMEILKRSLEPGEVLLREEEIPIEWMTRNGTKVTGRPDIVICAESTDISKTEEMSRRPVLGLELKSVHSIWTVRDVLFGARNVDKQSGEVTVWKPGPKLGNLAQAAHYMWRLGVPYKIIYKSYSQLGQSMSDWTLGLFNLPKQGEPNSQYVDYNNYGKIKGFKQFEVVYDIQIDEKGRVCYKLEDATNWTRSIITTQDIENYYEYVSEMNSKKELGSRPMTIDAHGDKLNYKMCGYCPAQATCDKYEADGYGTWLSEVRKIAK